MPPRTASGWIRYLQLQKHVEGGWYSEVYRSTLTVETHQPAIRRSACTHIYFLLEKGDFSALHRIRFDELWHFYAGDPLIVYELRPDKGLIIHKLGQDTRAGTQPFAMIPGGHWFGARLAPGGLFALLGCTVSPGFEFEDLELARADQLAGEFPGQTELIRSLCRH